MPKKERCRNLDYATEGTNHNLKDIASLAIRYTMNNSNLLIRITTFILLISSITSCSSAADQAKTQKCDFIKTRIKETEQEVPAKGDPNGSPLARASDMVRMNQEREEIRQRLESFKSTYLIECK